MLLLWKGDVVNNLKKLFESESSKIGMLLKVKDTESERLYTQIGKLSAQVEWLKKNPVVNFNRGERVSILDFNHSEQPVSTQADLLEINRSSLYYRPAPIPEDDFRIKPAIDKIYTGYPEFEYRRYIRIGIKISPMWQIRYIHIS